MATRKAKKAETEVVEPVTPIQGYRRAPRFDWVEFRPDDLPAEAEGLRVRIRTNLSFREIEDIPYGNSVKFADIFPIIAPYVVEWNHMGENLETGEWEPVPPPAEVGPDVFRTLEDVEALWLILAIKFKHRQKTEDDDAKKGETTPEPSDSP